VAGESIRVDVEEVTSSVFVAVVCSVVLIAIELVTRLERRA
jgi:hypothetical protein